MPSISNLELSGRLFDFTLAELLAESVAHHLSGSFRLSSDERKIAVYVDRGAVIYAASNLRAHRLPEIALSSGLLTADDLKQFRHINNDLEFGEKLVAAGKSMPAGLRELQTYQTTEILRVALNWFDGEWVFTPLIRVRDDLRVKPNLPPLLVESARKTPSELICRRFNSRTESYAANSIFPADVDLQTQEAFLLSRFDQVLTYEELQTVSNLPDTVLLRAVFVLWLGGFLNRYNWKGAFSEEKLAQIHAAKIAPTARPETVSAQPEIQTPSQPTAEPEKKPISIAAPVLTDEQKEKQELDAFLKRMAKAKTHYQVLNVEPKAEDGEIKRNYFALAKRFHPDKFHTAEPNLKAKLQEYFANISQAYDTLKDQKSRELYDFKIRKLNAAGTAAETTPEGCFKAGKTAFDDGNYLEAIRQFTHAIQLNPKIAAYHAAYAQSLTAVPKYRHQAESEFLAALKIEPNNAEYRLQLAEFYLEQRLAKRAEGEARRVLGVEPNNARAKRILDNLTAQQSRV